MNLRHLRYFLAIIETGNVTRAAQRARVAQPALSRQVRELERELGVQLLDRRPSGVAPTPAGEAFARGAVQVLAAIGGALDRAEATAAGQRGRVVMGALRAAIAVGLTTALEDRIRRDHPEITLVVQDADPPQVWEQVLSGETDLAVSLGSHHDRRLIGEPLFDGVLDHVIVPLNHALGRQPVVSLADLGALPLVISNAVPWESQRVVGELGQCGLVSPVLNVDGGLRAAHMAVAAGRGWTPITRQRISAPPEGAVVVRLRDVDIVVPATLIWRRSERRPVVRTVVEQVFQVTRENPPHAVRAEPVLPPLPKKRPSRKRPAGTLPVALELRHLQALLGVGAAQTIGRAAARLGITQSALSRQLRELEDLLGMHLLERSPRGVTLTPAGAALAGDVPDLFLSLEQLMREIGRAKRGMEGRCVIGAVATGPASGLLTDVIKEAATRYPHVRIVIEEIASPLQPPALLRGDLDLGLAHALPGLDAGDGIVRSLLMEDMLDGAVIGRDHPLAGRAELDPRDLDDVPFLFGDRSFFPRFYDALWAQFKTIGLKPLVDATYDGLQAVWSLAAQGKGWGVGFRSQRAQPPRGTVCIPIRGLALPWGLNLLIRKEEPSGAVRAVAVLIATQPRTRLRPS